MDRALAAKLGKELVRRAVCPVLGIGYPQLGEVRLRRALVRLLR
jgi:hypothetical protein